MHEFEKQHKLQYEDWYKISRTIVLLSVDSLAELELLSERFKMDNIVFSEFREPDLEDALTSLCVLSSEKVRKICKNLPLGLSEFLTERRSHVCL